MRQALLDAGCALGSAAKILRDRNAAIWCSFARDAMAAYETAGNMELFVAVFGRDLVVRSDLDVEGR
jgi:hypothetical protein